MYQHVSRVSRGCSVLAMHQVWKQSLWNKPAESTVNREIFFPIRSMFSSWTKCVLERSLCGACQIETSGKLKNTPISIVSQNWNLKKTWTEQISHTYILLAIDLSIYLSIYLNIIYIYIIHISMSIYSVYLYVQSLSFSSHLGLPSKLGALNSTEFSPSFPTTKSATSMIHSSWFFLYHPTQKHL